MYHDIQYNFLLFYSYLSWSVMIYSIFLSFLFLFILKCHDIQYTFLFFFLLILVSWYAIYFPIFYPIFYPYLSRSAMIYNIFFLIFILNYSYSYLSWYAIYSSKFYSYLACHDIQYILILIYPSVMLTKTRAIITITTVTK